MSDTLGSILGSLPKGKLKKKGNVYAAEDGSAFYPAKHYDDGNPIAFSSEADAEKANGMSPDEAQAAAANTGAGEGGSWYDFSKLDKINNSAPSQDILDKPTKVSIPRKIQRPKPRWVEKQEMYTGNEWNFNEEKKQWEPAQ